VKSLAAKRKKVRNWSADSPSMSVLYASGQLSFVGQYAHGRSHRVIRLEIPITDSTSMICHRIGGRAVAQTVVTESSITSLDKNSQRMSFTDRIASQHWFGSTLQVLKHWLTWSLNTCSQNSNKIISKF